MAEPLSRSWHERLAELVSRDRRAAALALIDDIIETDMPLFPDDPTIIAGRRVAWQIRISLLEEWGRRVEAFAWACLETDLYPDDVTGHVIKNRIRASLRLNPAHRARAAKVDHWPNVAGMRELKAILDHDVIYPLQEPALYSAYKVDLPNGILLYGPPGCGKTFIARELAKRLSFSFREVHPSSIASTYIHGTQEKIAEQFSWAEEHAPAILFFDEMEAMVPDRSGGTFAGKHYATEVNEFLQQMNECAKRKILVIGATNLPSAMDPAVLRPGRLDKKVLVRPPDAEARFELFKMCLADRPQDGIDLRVLAGWSHNYTCAEIRLVVDEAARDALTNRKRITMDHLSQALAHNQPQFSEADLRAYEMSPN